jgi:hypothetical protein
MSRPRNIPEKGDVPKSVVAQRLGLSIVHFEALQPKLNARGFPAADPTTGLFCIEAVDRWRLKRHANLFPELTGTHEPAHAASVFDERLERLNG